MNIIAARLIVCFVLEDWELVTFVTDSRGP